MAKKEIEKKDELATIPQGGELLTSEFLAELQGDSGKGFENVSMRDVAIPFLAILQSNSPQVKKGPARIDGAEEGHIFHTVRQTAFDPTSKPMFVIPCGFQKRWVEWIDRDSGGGFVASHADDSILSKCTKNDKGKMVLGNGNLVVETAYHYVIFVDEFGNSEQAVIGMASTSLKKSRRWMSQLMSLQIENNGRKFNPPMYSHVWSLGTIMETKDSNSWFGWDIKNPMLIADPVLYHKARDFYKVINETGFEVSPSTQEPEAASSTADVSDY